MSDKLPYWQMAQLAGKHKLDAGEQLDINHEHCPAGLDRKRRLNIRRTDDGNVLLFRCNHCGSGGGYHLTTKQVLKARGTRRDPLHAGRPVNSLPGDTTFRLEGFSPKGRVWVGRYLRDSEVRRHRIGYSETLNRVVLPIFRGGKLVAYQSRRLEGEGPKYISYGLHGEKYLYLQEPENNTLVICEDYLSAVKCHRYADSVALLGISMPDVVLDKVVKKGYDRVVVWLDHDNAFVTKQERKLVRRLEMYIPQVEYVRSTDPKSMTDEELKEVLL